MIAGDALFVSSGLYSRVEKRDLKSGARVRAFGANGVVQGDSGTRTGPLVADGSALYLAYFVDQAPHVRVEKRDLASGALVEAFGLGGSVTPAMDGIADSPEALRLHLFRGAIAKAREPILEQLLSIRTSSGMPMPFLIERSLSDPADRLWSAIQAVLLTTPKLNEAGQQVLECGGAIITLATFGEGEWARHVVHRFEVPVALLPKQCVSP